jgi:hypothetical protein
MEAHALADKRPVGDIRALVTIPWLGQPWAFLPASRRIPSRGYRQHGLFRTRLGMNSSPSSGRGEPEALFTQRE